ncbi:MAG TPA: pilus assembly protein PilE [Xanthomonadaceae bacterium]|jgi:type IV pilus assembly protein PilE|nr:pilus assembly protein PilE [Xanthomonadaceae bacterium]
MRSTRSRGFTLIEIMITVLIVGVLAAIALTSYQRNVVETRRKAATACLIEAAQSLERFYTTRLTYVGSPDPATVLTCANDLAAFYRFESVGAALGQRTFLVRATAQGVQASRDTGCTDLSLNQAGQRFVGATPGGGACW